MIDYSKRLVEVDEVLKHLSEGYYKKIPEEIVEVIKQNKDKNYTWNYDTSKKLKDQDLSDDTIAILSYINMEFLLNNEQKDFVNRLHILNINGNFNNKKDYKDMLSERLNKKIKIDANLTIVHRKTIFQKIINKIKNTFNKSN